jgi:hypothetical protein
MLSNIPQQSDRSDSRVELDMKNMIVVIAALKA